MSKDLSKKTPAKAAPEGALFVRLPAAAVDKLDRAAEATGLRKKDLVAGLVSKFVDPDSRSGLSTLGSYSFRAYESATPPEVMNAAEAGDFLRIEEAVVLELAESGKLPGRKLGAAWRFSRAALVAWLAQPEIR
jgi:excisionase family DNA binding protein